MSSDVLQWLDRPELQVLNITAKVKSKWAEEISRRYSEDGRYYHTLQHLADIMQHLHTWSTKVTDHTAVLLAILFHDVVYNAQSSTNEDDSVDLFKSFAGEVALSDELCHKVREMIKATIKHLPPGDLPLTNEDLLFFLDFDMAILGQPEQNYDLYAENIRKEYCHMTEENFCKGRIKVLQTFLGRPKIYFTEELRTAFEEQARLNMLREIDSLQTQLSNLER